MDEPKFDPSLLLKNKKKKKVAKIKPAGNPSVIQKKNDASPKEIVGTPKGEVAGRIYFDEEEKKALAEHHGSSSLGEKGEKEGKKKKELYTYDQMLAMLYGNVNREEVGKRRKIPLPTIENDGFGGGVKTMVTNYRLICQELGRDEQHVLLFLNVEIICKKKVSECGVLTLMGRYNQAEFLKVVKNYIIEYVDCKTCGGRHTVLKKENGIMFVSCLEDRCGGKRSVAKLKHT